MNKSVKNEIMVKTLKYFFVVILFLQNVNIHAQGKPVDLVNPFIDTHNSRWFYFNSASRPFGMVNLSPDTNTAKTWSSGYLYDSEYIRCFSHIHAWQLAGIAVMPTTGEFKGHLGMDAYQSSFSHEGEIAKPGYHKIYLNDYDIHVELTSSTRVGFHKYKFPKDKQKSIIFDTGARLAHGPTTYSKVWKVSNFEIAGVQVLRKTGRRPKDTPVYFVAKLSVPFKSFKGWENKELVEKSTDTIQGVNAGVGLFFDRKNTDEVLMKVGISYVSVEQARKNLDAEINHWDFNKVVDESLNTWNEWLSKIEIKGGTHQQRVKFYTDLWHALLGRRIVSDVDGKYIDRTGDEAVTRTVRLDNKGKPLFPHYNFDAWWGSHWSLNILWSMVYPEVMDGFCNSMLDMYNNGGLIPRGPSGGNYTFVMIGDPSTSFFATAYNKGIRSYDIQKAYEGLRKNAFVGGSRDHAGYEHKSPAYGGGMRYYIDQGWIPEGIKAKGAHKDGASMTLEYAYQDWCLAQLSKTLGKDDDYEMFLKRSQNYKNLWNPDTGMMHPREMDGNWIKDFKPVSETFNARGFCESNSAIYTHFVPHDMSGLVQLFGGKQKYNNFLNESFVKGETLNFVGANKNHAASWVDYGNQPGTGMAHLFNYSGAPWLTQKWVRKVKEVYGDVTPYGGYYGDEDQGQMGALGVLMAMGLFQVDGGASVKPYYEITSPLFDEVTIKLNNDYYSGEVFNIKTSGVNQENIYIQSAKLNGGELNNCWFYHESFVKGGTLELQLGANPNKEWGVDIPPPSYKTNLD
ncbi:GH92 family glycosyl hydrolase [Seonamhaeicola maritimus]|uniref:Glycoside hydrolase family 92 protein n=1 Tax=Seonamhaeicola maritimus TaxID=2591822 RepID=A0A5C7GLW7_9FLAO|nr:GH92 family glycosyl hydrolase [Seonamhaeicola maritimus]TXG39047.1 glycoside hydrolase family 92 protein [Seonamhaeicola maritimus]